MSNYLYCLMIVAYPLYYNGEKALVFPFSQKLVSLEYF